MQTPKSGLWASACADTYKVIAVLWQDGRYEVCTSGATGYDHCGVHFNSGVLNKWFYLLTVGDSGTNGNNYNYHVSRIGFDSKRRRASVQTPRVSHGAVASPF